MPTVKFGKPIFHQQSSLKRSIIQELNRLMLWTNYSVCRTAAIRSRRVPSRNLKEYFAVWRLWRTTAGPVRVYQRWAKRCSVIQLTNVTHKSSPAKVQVSTWNLNHQRYTFDLIYVSFFSSFVIVVIAVRLPFSGPNSSPMTNDENSTSPNTTKKTNGLSPKPLGRTGAHDDQSAARPTLIRTRMQRSQSQNELLTDDADESSTYENSKLDLIRRKAMNWCLSRRLWSIWFSVSTVNLSKRPSLASAGVLSDELRCSAMIDPFFVLCFRKCQCRLWGRWSSDISLTCRYPRAWLQWPGVFCSFYFPRSSLSQWAAATSLLSSSSSSSYHISNNVQSFPWCNWT